MNNKVVKDGVTYINDILIVNKKIKLPCNYNKGINVLALLAFENMKKEATKEGFDLKIQSSFRSYERQKEIYEEYVKEFGKELADTFSAKPGHSEHQTGLAFDIGIVDDSYINTKESKWLEKNAHKFGFIIRYQKGKENITGYKYEPWHIRYVGVMHANNMYNSNECLEEYLGLV